MRLLLDNLPTIRASQVAHIGARHYGEHITLDGCDVTREHCIIERLELGNLDRNKLDTRRTRL